MEITVTQFKAKCLGVIERVQREKCRVVISRHGHPAAELLPLSDRPKRQFFGRASRQTVLKGDIMTTGEAWSAGD